MVIKGHQGFIDYVHALVFGDSSRIADSGTAVHCKFLFASVDYMIEAVDFLVYSFYIYSLLSLVLLAFVSCYPDIVYSLLSVQWAESACSIFPVVFVGR